MMSTEVVILEQDAMAPSIIGSICDHVVDTTGELSYNARDLCDRCFPVGKFDCSRTSLVVFDDDKNVVGFCALNFYDGLHLSCLCVDEKHRRRGIGTAILDAALLIGQTLDRKRASWGDDLLFPSLAFAEDPGFRHLILEVDRHSASYCSLEAFYMKNGFEVSDMDKRDGLSSVSFRKRIQCCQEKMK